MAQGQFIVGRGALRCILGSYGGVAASAIRFKYGAFGKPELDGGPDLSFNVSHSDEIVLIATSTTACVGVDVERVRESVSYEELGAQPTSPLRTRAR